MRYVVTIIASAICGVVLAWMTGCTPAHREAAGNASVLSAKIAACAQSAIAEEEERRARDARLAELEAEQEAERIREAAREHTDTTKEEIEKVLKDGAKE